MDQKNSVGWTLASFKQPATTKKCLFMEHAGNMKFSW